MMNIPPDFSAYLLLGFMLAAMALAFWLRFTWLPGLFSPPSRNAEPRRERAHDSNGGNVVIFCEERGGNVGAAESSV
ncbi:hypothetical protein DCC62_05435 [candidate division KSB1 bacterium]|nr:MAG: hypothetical protein DCC62_05435 [candidate division KSB1 bacterium]